MSEKDELAAIAHALHRLGTNNADTQMGGLEAVALEIRDGCQNIAEALLEVAEALRERNGSE